MIENEELNLFAEKVFTAERNSDKGRLIEAANELTKFCLSKLPKNIQPLFKIAYDYFKKGSLVIPETICRAIRARVNDQFESTHLLAIIAMRSKRYDATADLLIECVRLKPNLATLHHDLAESLLRASQYEFALKECDIILENEPSHFPTLGIKAESLVKLAKYKAALEIYEQLLKEQPENQYILTRKGQVHRILGQSVQARDAYAQALVLAPDHAEAQWNIVNLDAASVDEKSYLTMQASYEKATAEQKIYLANALGKYCEANQKFDEAFKYYSEGKELSKAKTHYDSDAHTRVVKSYIDTFDQEFIDKLSNGGDTSSDPIFILGLPRSGSTLLEQILGSHSQIDATIELTEIFAMVKSLSRVQIDNKVTGYPNVLKHLSENEFTGLGREYIKRTRVYRDSGNFFTDKTPRNFLYIGLIKSILPKAKIIDARRKPMDVGLSIFKQHFPEGFNFANDLHDIGRYYADYIGLMKHWNCVFPGAILTVDYEKVVSNTEDEVRRILDFLGLPFEDACLNFHANKRAVATISAEQVRQPIYSKSVDYWENFESHLLPLKEGLGL